MPRIDELPSEKSVSPRSPGFLLTPFGWAAEPLTILVDAEPRLLADLFAISRPRMHLIALALAHLDSAVPPDIGPLLLRGSVRQVLDRAVAQRPAGIKRVLSRLPVGFRSSLLALASLDLACRDHCPDVSATLTTTAFDRSSSRWLGISDLIAEPEGPSFISRIVTHRRLDRRCS